MLTIRLVALGILGAAFAASAAQTAAQSPAPAEQRDTLSDELQRCRVLRERAATDEELALHALVPLGGWTGAYSNWPVATSNLFSWGEAA